MSTIEAPLALESGADAPARGIGVFTREVLAGLHRVRKPIPAAVFDTKVRKPLTGSAGKGAAKAQKRFCIGSDVVKDVAGGHDSPPVTVGSSQGLKP